MRVRYNTKFGEKCTTLNGRCFSHNISLKPHLIHVLLFLIALLGLCTFRADSDLPGAIITPSDLLRQTEECNNPHCLGSIINVRTATQ